jgi:hypothetical protein
VTVSIPAVDKTKALWETGVRGTAAFVRTDKTTTIFFISLPQEKP